MINEVQAVILISIMRDDDNPLTIVAGDTVRKVKYEPTPFDTIYRFVLIDDKIFDMKSYNCATEDIVSLVNRMMFDLKDGFSIEEGFKVGD